MKFTRYQLREMRHCTFAKYFSLLNLRANHFHRLVGEPLLVTDNARDIILPSHNKAMEYFEDLIALAAKLNLHYETTRFNWEELGEFYAYIRCQVSVSREYGGEKTDFDTKNICFMMKFNGIEWRILHLIQYSTRYLL